MHGHDKKRRFSGFAFISQATIAGRAAAAAGAAGVAGLTGTGVYFWNKGYNEEKFRDMIHLHAPVGQTKFNNIGEFVALVKIVKDECPHHLQQDPTLMALEGLAAFFEDFDQRFVGMEEVKLTLLRTAIAGLLRLNKKMMDNLYP